MTDSPEPEDFQGLPEQRELPWWRRFLRLALKIAGTFVLGYLLLIAAMICCFAVCLGGLFFSNELANNVPGVDRATFEQIFVPISFLCGGIAGIAAMILGVKGIISIWRRWNGRKYKSTESHFREK